MPLGSYYKFKKSATLTLNPLSRLLWSFKTHQMRSIESQYILQQVPILFPATPSSNSIIPSCHLIQLTPKQGPIQKDWETEAHKLVGVPG